MHPLRSCLKLLCHTHKANPLRKMALPLCGMHFSNASKFQSLKLCDPFEAILSYFDDTRN